MSHNAHLRVMNNGQARIRCCYGNDGGQTHSDRPKMWPETARHSHGTQQHYICSKKELGKKECKKDSKEVGQKACKKDHKELSKKVPKKDSKELDKKVYKKNFLVICSDYAMVAR